MTPDYAGMTLNERLFVAGLMDEFDAARSARDVEALVTILREVRVDRSEEQARAILAGQAQSGEYEMTPALVEIQRLLLEEWDPIGVSGIPEAADEYDRYAFQLYAMLQAPTRPSVQEIGAYLGRVQTEWIGLDLTPDKNHRVARKIAGLQES